MIKLSAYVLILVLICVIGLTIGSANDSLVTFDYLIAKSTISVANVFVVGIIVGLILGIYISLLFCLKMWAKARGARSEFKKYKKNEAKVEKEPYNKDKSQKEAL